MNNKTNTKVDIDITKTKTKALTIEAIALSLLFVCWSSLIRVITEPTLPPPSHLDLQTNLIIRTTNNIQIDIGINSLITDATAVSTVKSSDFLTDIAEEVLDVSGVSDDDFGRNVSFNVLILSDDMI
jgi:hypothetical protein